MSLEHTYNSSLIFCSRPMASIFALRLFSFSICVEALKQNSFFYCRCTGVKVKKKMYRCDRCDYSLSMSGQTCKQEKIRPSFYCLKVWGKCCYSTVT